MEHMYNKHITHPNISQNGPGTGRTRTDLYPWSFCRHILPIRLPYTCLLLGTSASDKGELQHQLILQHRYSKVCRSNVWNPWIHKPVCTGGLPLGSTKRAAPILCQKASQMCKGWLTVLNSRVASRWKSKQLHSTSTVGLVVRIWQGCPSPTCTRRKWRARTNKSKKKTSCPFAWNCLGMVWGVYADVISYHVDLTHLTLKFQAEVTHMQRCSSRTSSPGTHSARCWSCDPQNSRLVAPPHGNDFRDGSWRWGLQQSFPMPSMGLAYSPTFGWFLW